MSRTGGVSNVEPKREQGSTKVTGSACCGTDCCGGRRDAVNDPLAPAGGITPDSKERVS